MNYRTESDSMGQIKISTPCRLWLHVFLLVLILSSGISCHSHNEEKTPGPLSGTYLHQNGISKELTAKKVEIEKWKNKLIQISVLLSKYSGTENHIEELTVALHLPDASSWKKWFESGANVEFINLDDFSELADLPSSGKKKPVLSFFDRGPVNQALRAYRDVSDWEKGTIRPNGFNPNKSIYQKMDQVQYLLVIKVEEFVAPEIIDSKSYYSGQLKMRAFLIDCTDEPKIRGSTKITVNNDQHIEFMPYQQSSSQQVSFQANLILLSQFEQKSREQLISNLKELLDKKH